MGGGLQVRIGAGGTRLRRITIQVGRTGVLTPVAELEPVVLAGSKVARATLHNRDEIARRDLRVGDFVYVEKAGEIIPALVGVNLGRRPAEAVPFVFPTVCPACRTAVVQRAGEVAVRCPVRPVRRNCGGGSNILPRRRASISRVSGR